MLQGYLASYNLPISCPKKQLIARLTSHIRHATTRQRTHREEPAESSDFNKSSPSSESLNRSRSQGQQGDPPTTSDQPSSGQSESSSHLSPRRSQDQRRKQQQPTRSHKDHHTPSHRHQDSSSDSYPSPSPPRRKHRHHGRDSLPKSSRHKQLTPSSQGQLPDGQHQVQAHHNASDTVEPGTAPCRHQVHLDANAIAESGTAPYHHQFHHGAGVTGTAPSHQQACPAAQRLRLQAAQKTTP